MSLPAISLSLSSLMFAQADAVAAPEVSPLMLALGAIASLLFFIVVYQAFVSVPALQNLVAEARREKHEVEQELDAERQTSQQHIDAHQAAADQKLWQQKRESEQTLSRERAAADRRLADVNKEIDRLKEEAKQYAEMPRLKSQLCAAKLGLHVASRLRDRLESRLREYDSDMNDQLRDSQTRYRMACVQADCVRRKLRDAELSLHVQQRLHNRLEREARCEVRRRVVAAECAAVMQRKAELEIHILRRRQQRLEAHIREQGHSIEAATQRTSELTSQVESLQGTVRTQSEQAIKHKLAEAERASESLRQLQNRLHAAELSPEECLAALTDLANGSTAARD